VTGCSCKMVLGVSNCGCLQGLVSHRAKSHAKYELAEPQACHHEEVQARITAFHAAKQRLEDEATPLLELENAAKARPTADAEKLKHAELVGQLEKAQAELETKQQLEASHEAAAQLKKVGTSYEEVTCPPVDDSNSSLASTQIESACDAVSDDGQDGIQYHDGTTSPESPKQAMINTPNSPMRCRSLQGAMKPVTIGDDSMKLFAGGQQETEVQPPTSEQLEAGNAPLEMETEQPDAGEKEEAAAKCIQQGWKRRKQPTEAMAPVRAHRLGVSILQAHGLKHMNQFHWRQSICYL